MAAILEGDGLETASFESLEDWAPGLGGAVVFLRATSAPGADVSAFVEDHPHIPLLAVVDSMEVSTFAEWVRAGAAGVLAESEDPADFVRSALASRSDRSVVPLKVMRAMAERVPTHDDLSTWIDAGERVWLREMAAGCTVAELANELGYSERAMFRNLRRLYVRLGVKNRTEALLWAERSGVFD
jgi:DNA-binding NarL/FixJ family response regulator